MPGQLRSYLSLVCRIWHAPGNRGHRISRLLRSIFWLFNKKTLRRPWTLSVYQPEHGLKLRCYPGSVIALHVVQRSEWHDWDTAQFITGFLRPGDTFVDVGANIGLYTLPAARIVGSTGSVIAVEPSPINRARLLENLQVNTVATVQIEPCALGESLGSMAFNDEDALAHLDPSGAVSGSGTSVPIQTLDSILPPGGEVSLLKVDVEGFELAVFRGGLQSLQAGRLPVILFEMNDSHLRYGVSSETILNFLRDLGYQIARYEHNARRLVQTDLQGDILAFTPRGEQLIADRLLQSP